MEMVGERELEGVEEEELSTPRRGLCVGRWGEGEEVMVEAPAPPLPPPPPPGLPLSLGDGDRVEPGKGEEVDPLPSSPRDVGVAPVLRLGVVASEGEGIKLVLPPRQSLAVTFAEGVGARGV